MYSYSHVVTERNFISYCQTFPAVMGVAQTGLIFVLAFRAPPAFLEGGNKTKKRFFKNNSLNMPSVVGNLGL